MQLFHLSLFSDHPPEVQKGWNFFKNKLEIKNPDRSTSLFGGIEQYSDLDTVRITKIDGYLNNEHPHVLKKDFRIKETLDRILLTIVSDGYVSIPKSFFTKKYVKIVPERKKNGSLVFVALCLPKDKEIIIVVKNKTKQKEIFIEFISSLNYLNVRDVTNVIIKTTLTTKAIKFLKELIFKRRGVFGYF
jgi:hypothetical protein